jgi:hypothetical protein
MMNRITRYYNSSISADMPIEKKVYNVKYYSDGRLLPNPFHTEYRLIANTVANSWIYEEQWQGLVNENHDAPIVDIEIFIPFKYKYSYTFKQVFLANSYLQDQKNYLENLS